MADNSSLYGSTPPSGSVSSSNYTTLYSGGNNFVPSGDNVIISGTLTVNGCSILTDCSAFNLLPFNATTVSAFGAATAVSIGGATGVTTIQNQLSTGNYLFPLADGTANQILATDGSGVLYWADVQTLDTNYTIDASATTGGANFNLQGSDSTTDTIKFANGSGVSVVRTDANTITITNTDPGSAGVTSITGTANQVIASSPTGAVTLSLPQSIATTNSPTFQNMLLNGSLTVNLDGTGSDGVIYVNSSTGSPQSTLRWNGAQWIFDDNVYITQTSATTNARISPLALTATSSGTAAVGIATSLDYVTESTYSGNLNSGYISVRMDDNTAGSEDFSMRFGLKQNGATYSTKAILDSGGNLILDGGITVSGSTSGSSTFNAPATGSTLTYTLPGAAGAASTVLTNDGSGNLSWALPGGGGSTFGNISIGVVTDNTIASTDTNGDIIIQPNGTGDVNISADTLFIGDGGSSAAITTNGSGGLYLNTNNFTNSGQMFLEAGVNGDIVLAPYTGGLGQVKTYNDFVVNDTNLYVDTTNNRVGINTASPLQELTVNAAGDGYCQIGMENTERTWLVTNNDGDDLVSYSVVIPSPFSVTNRFQFDTVGGDQWFNSGKLGVGTNAPAHELDVQGTGSFSSNLIATGGFTLNGATSGSSTFSQTPTGSAISYLLPTAQGASSTVLTNDGSGNLSWALPGGGGSTFGNITIAVDTDNTISTTTGDLVVTSATGIVEMGAIVNITGDYININSDNTYTNAAVRFGGSAEIVYTVATDNFEITKPIGNITIAQATDNTISTSTGDLVLASATNVIDATTAIINADGYTIDSRGTIDSSTLTTTSTATVTLNNTTRNGLKCLISVVDNVTSARHIVEALLLEQGTTAYITTYAEMYSSAALATFSAVISAGNLTLQATPASANSTTFTVIRTSIN